MWHLAPALAPIDSTQNLQHIQPAPQTRAAHRMLGLAILAVVRTQAAGRGQGVYRQGGLDGVLRQERLESQLPRHLRLRDLELERLGLGLRLRLRRRRRLWNDPPWQDTVGREVLGRVAVD
eukprot:8934650-Alexandrium_andersonii.AAC.1